MKRWKGPRVGGAFAEGTEGKDGSLNLAGGVGLKPEVSGPTTGPDDKKVIAAWGVDDGVGLNPEACDPTTGPDDRKGVVGWGPAAKGVEAGLAGKLGRLGFSVPIGFVSLTQSPCNIYTPMS